MTREAAIARLRRILLSFCSAGDSACRAAAEHDLLCRGFRHMTDAQLRARFAEVIDIPPGASREEMEEKANAWLLERQRAADAPTVCDFQRRTHLTCRGWDEFSNGELAKFCFEMMQIDVVVIGPEHGRSGQWAVVSGQARPPG